MAKAAAFGTKLLIGTQAVGALTSISGIEVSADTIDVSAMDNTTGYREKVAGLKDAGEVSVSGFFDGADAGQTAMYTALGSGAETDFTIMFPSTIAKKWTFKGIVTGFSTGADMDNAVTFDATIAVSGEAKLEAASSGT